MERELLNPEEVRELIQDQQQLAYLRYKINKERKKAENLAHRFAAIMASLKAEGSSESSAAVQPSPAVPAIKPEEDVVQNGVNQEMSAGGQHDVGEPNMENRLLPNANE